MKRKAFIQKSIGVLMVGIPAITIVGCSSSDSDSGESNPNPNPGPGAQVSCVENGTKNTISANHGHTLSVPKGDVQQGLEKTYSIKGSSVHTHSVTLSASDFTSLKANNGITVTSTAGDGHSHSVTVSCA